MPSWSRIPLAKRRPAWCRFGRALLFCTFAGALAALPAQSPADKCLTAAGGECLFYAMTLWGEAYQAHTPGVSVKAQVNGEATAMRDLAEGRIDMALLARNATPDEIGRFRSRWGYAPTRISVAMDALVWVVNRDNPIRSLRIEDLFSIFSEGWDPVRATSILTWGEAGVRAPGWVDRPIIRYAHPMDSSVVGLIMQYLPPAPPRLPVTFVPDAMAMTEALAADPAGICAANLVEVFASVKAIPVVPAGATTPVPPTPETVSTGAYPYSRLLYVYVNKHPKAGLEPILRGFLAFALSEDGQRLVRAAGQAPLPKDINALNLFTVTGELRASYEDVR